MALEQLTNTAQTTINQVGGIDNTSDPVTFTVTSATGFPTSGNFHILIDLEILLVTAVSGTSFTASRAQESTTIATHSNGSNVTLILTAQSLKNLIQDRTVQQGTLSARPTAGIPGRPYFSSDGTLIHIDNGTTWDQYCTGPFKKVSPPVSSDYSWQSQGNSTVSWDNDGAVVQSTGIGTGEDLRGLYRSWPTAPFKYDIGLIHNNPWGTYSSGIYWSDGTKWEAFNWFYNASTNTIASWRWSNNTTFNTTNFQLSANPPMSNITWLRFEDTSSAWNCYISNDGQNWLKAGSPTRNGYFTPTRIGAFFNPRSVSAVYNARWLHALVS
jgi:hypothetical protein